MIGSSFLFSHHGAGVGCASTAGLRTCWRLFPFGLLASCASLSGSAGAVRRWVSSARGAARYSPTRRIACRQVIRRCSTPVPLFTVLLGWLSGRVHRHQTHRRRGGLAGVATLMRFGTWCRHGVTAAAFVSLLIASLMYAIGARMAEGARRRRSAGDGLRQLFGALLPSAVRHVQRDNDTDSASHWLLALGVVCTGSLPLVLQVDSRCRRRTRDHGDVHRSHIHRSVQMPRRNDYLGVCVGCAGVFAVR